MTNKTRDDVLDAELWANPYMPITGYCYSCGFDLVQTSRAALMAVYGSDTIGITGCPSCHRSFVE